MPSNGGLPLLSHRHMVLAAQRTVLPTSRTCLPNILLMGQFAPFDMPGWDYFIHGGIPVYTPVHLLVQGRVFGQAPE